MKRRLKILSLCIVLIFQSSLYAEETSKPYGKSGEFEISAGLSGADTYNAQGRQEYNLRLLPFANHFLFDNVFLRYDFGASLGFTRADYIIGNSYFTWAINPGLGAGYSFNLATAWRLNTSLGYGVVVQQSVYSDSPANPVLTQHSIRAYPELKYLINDKWSLSVLLQVSGNFAGALNRVSNSFEVRTVGYIVAAYRL